MRSHVENGPIHGRGSSINLPNRFERTYHERELEGLDPDDVNETSPTTELIVDRTRTIVAKNDSPDVGFEVSVNPYRGCEHGCAYCYARPTREYLGYSSGLDFETKILIKPEAPTLLRKALSSPSW